MIYATQDYRTKQDYTDGISGDVLDVAVWSIAPTATLDGQVDTDTSTKISVSGLSLDVVYILTVQITGTSSNTYVRQATINAIDSTVVVTPFVGGWAGMAARVNAAELRVFGESITYIPSAGVGDPIQTRGIVTAPTIDQSASPGYFADIHVNPTVITNPQRKDQVIFADGTFYIVSRVERSLSDAMYTLALHRKFDPS